MAAIALNACTGQAWICPSAMVLKPAIASSMKNTPDTAIQASRSPRRAPRMQTTRAASPTASASSELRASAWWGSSSQPTSTTSREKTSMLARMRYPLSGRRVTPISASSMSPSSAAQAAAMWASRRASMPESEIGSQPR